eukprot:6395404-Amphidinium_carterae.1
MRNSASVVGVRGVCGAWGCDPVAVGLCWVAGVGARGWGFLCGNRVFSTKVYSLLCALGAC